MPVNLQVLRNTEIETIRHLFPPNSTVLEIGGGNGYQAALLAGFGCQVTSIDISTGTKPGPTYYPVQEYNGSDLPFPDREFDVVFSSNVLEHVKDLPRLLQEIHRVTRTGGLSIHIVPTPYWRLWTSLAHYPYLIKYLASKLGLGQPVQGSGSSFVARHGMWKSIQRLMSAGPHGEFPNAMTELYYFSAHHWSHIFRRNGYLVKSTETNKLFYTGYGLFPGLSLEWRRRLARFLGSSCYIFVLEKNPVHLPNGR